jgi:[ribosomal protein S5]-alanine N-acetyltransferase
MDLVLMSPTVMRTLLASDWDQAGQLLGARVPDEWRDEDWQWIGQRPDQAEADPSVRPWLPRVMLLRPTGVGDMQKPIVVGEAGFHGPPDGGRRVEIGCMVVSEYRRRGYAEEAARTLMAWATAERGISRFRACISPHNTPSLNLVRKLGFVQVGTQHQERRGEELISHHDSEADGPRVNHDPDMHGTIFATALVSATSHGVIGTNSLVRDGGLRNRWSNASLRRGRSGSGMIANARPPRIAG